MSKIGCTCGHVIRDQSDALPYKAELTLDIDVMDGDQSIDTEIQSYIEAVKAGAVSAWLSARGASQSYLDLELQHGQILFEWILGRSRNWQKAVYECESCGRLLVEGANNQFFPYSPDSKAVNHVLSISKRTGQS